MPRHNKPAGVFTALSGGAISRFRILKPGADDDHVVQATASSSLIIGVSGFGDGTDPSMISAAEEQVDVITEGFAYVEYGGTVTRGQRLTSDSLGRAVTASATHHIIGVALCSGVIGDVGSVKVALGSY